MIAVGIADRFIKQRDFRPDQSMEELFYTGYHVKGKQVAGNFSLYWSDRMFFGLTWSCIVML